MYNELEDLKLVTSDPIEAMPYFENGLMKIAYSASDIATALSIDDNNIWQAEDLEDMQSAIDSMEMNTSQKFWIPQSNLDVIVYLVVKEPYKTTIKIITKFKCFLPKAGTPPPKGAG